MKYQTTLDGIAHEYEIRNDGLALTKNQSPTIFVRFDELSRVSAGRGDSLKLIPRIKKAPRIEIKLPPTQMPAFINEFFEVWGTRSHGQATKAAFDYSSNERTLAWLWVVMSLLFPGMLAVLLLGDGIETAMCSRQLNEGSLANAQVLKVKKNKRGNFTWNLEFKTASGQTVTGKRISFVYDEKGNPTTKDVTVVYAAANPKCFDLSMVVGQNAVNRRQRAFTVFLTLPLGIGFAVTTIVGLLIGVLRLRRRTPYAKEVMQAGTLLASRQQKAPA